MDNYAIQNNLPYQENSSTQTQPPTSDQINAALVNQPNTSVANSVANSTQAQNLQNQLNQLSTSASPNPNAYYTKSEETPVTYSTGTFSAVNSSSAPLATQPAQAQMVAPGSMFIGSTTPVSTKQ